MLVCHSKNLNDVTLFIPLNELRGFLSNNGFHSENTKIWYNSWVYICTNSKRELATQIDIQDFHLQRKDYSFLSCIYIYIYIFLEKDI